MVSRLPIEVRSKLTFRASGVPVGLCVACRTTLLQPFPMTVPISSSSYLIWHKDDADMDIKAPADAQNPTRICAFRRLCKHEYLEGLGVVTHDHPRRVNGHVSLDKNIPCAPTQSRYGQHTRIPTNPAWCLWSPMCGPAPFCDSPSSMKSNDSSRAS